MNTQNLSTLQVFKSLPTNAKAFSFSSVLEKLSQPSLNAQKIFSEETAIFRKTSSDKVSKWSSFACSKKITWKHRRDVLASEKVLQLLKVVIPPIINRLSWNGIPVFVYNNKSSNTQTITKQAFSKHQVEQHPMYQIDSLKKEVNKKLFAKADYLVDKMLSQHRTKHSNSQTLKLDAVKTAVLRLAFAQKLHRKNADVPHIYFIILDAAGFSLILVLNQNGKA